MKIANRLLALLVSLALIVGGVVLVIEILAQRTGADFVVADWPTAVTWAQDTTWSSTTVRLVSILLVLVGVVLLLAQLRPRWRSRLALDTGDPATDVAITRRGLAHTLSAAVGTVDGIHNPHVTVKRRKIKIRARTRNGPTADVASRREAVTHAARQRLDALRLHRAPALVVRVSVGGR